MWPSGHGSKPTFSKTDAAFLGQKTGTDAPDTGEPTWDDSIYRISVACREDYYGENPANPDRERLQAELRVRDVARRTAKSKAKGD